MIKKEIYRIHLHVRKVLTYWKLNRCIVRGQIRDKVRKVCSSQI